MQEDILYTIRGLYRDDFRVRGFRFGSGEKSVCIMGSMRGNEYQQIFVSSLIVKKLTQLEEEGRIEPGHEILVIPCANPYSVNTKKRFWSIDNTDINRMYPGYDKGETTQRIADGIFREICHYKYGIQFASFYMPGHFVPQVRMMKTGLENVSLAKEFGLPYVVLHQPRPFDTTTLNYNWQIWETEAFSVYTTSTSEIDRRSASQALEAVLCFMAHEGMIRYRPHEGYRSRVVETADMVTVRTSSAGFLENLVPAGERAWQGQVLARITDPYTAQLKEELVSPVDGTIAFAYSETIVYQNTAVIKLIPEEPE